MIPYLNFIVLIVSSGFFTLFYVWSVSPETLEKRIGSLAYPKCATYRMVSSLFMLVVSVNYILYYWFPLPLPLPRTFPWTWWISAVIAVIIAIPSVFLIFRGVKDAGEETIKPKREHTMYEGIYKQIRHPQALGEFPLWWVVAFLVHSPFLAIFSFVYIPIWYYFCVAEERDLLIRYGTAYEEYREKTGFCIPKSRKKDNTA